MSASVHYEDAHLTVWLGDAREALAAMEPESVDCVVSSPPYCGLRDYGIPPSVWGGDSSHEHDWTERTTPAKSGGTGASSTLGPASGGHGISLAGVQRSVARQGHAGSVSGSCACGAWRGSLGLEPTPEMFVEHLVEVFREVRRVLRKDGTVWLNLGDSYASGKGHAPQPGETLAGGKGGVGDELSHRGRPTAAGSRLDARDFGMKPKDRVMIPARVALALQADGWWLRDEIVWAKPNPMPSSVRDRTTPAHEMVYLLTKAARYHYDADAIAEPTSGPDNERNRFGARLDVGLPDGRTPDRRRNGPRVKVPGGWDVAPGAHGTVHRNGRTAATYRESTLPGSVSASTERQRVGINARWDESEASGTAPLTRNKRSVWTVATQPYPEAHFATFPEALIEPMILAGCPPDGVVLDPFGGSGTVAVVAQRLSRRAVLVDLSPEYVEQMIRRVATARGAGDGPAVDMPVPFAADGLWSVP